MIYYETCFGDGVKVYMASLVICTARARIDSHLDIFISDMWTSKKN